MLRKTVNCWIKTAPVWYRGLLTLTESVAGDSVQWKRQLHEVRTNNLIAVRMKCGRLREAEEVKEHMLLGYPDIRRVRLVIHGCNPINIEPSSSCLLL